MDLYGITPYLERAKALMASGEDHSLRYACLELRFCLETVAFRQLQQYAETLPGDVIGKWQADQVMRRLASFDPHSEMEGTLAFSTQKPDAERPEEWVDIGQTRPISWRKFRTYHNKLGSFLHVPVPKNPDLKKVDKKLTADSLSEIVRSLESAAKATLILAMKHVIHGKCRCDNTLFVGAYEFENDDLVVCSNTKCNSLFSKITNDDGEKVLTPVDAVIFKCQCEAKIPVDVSRIWSPIRCPDCSASYRVDLAFSRVNKI